MIGKDETSARIERGMLRWEMVVSQNRGVLHRVMTFWKKREDEDVHSKIPIRKYGNTIVSLVLLTACCVFQMDRRGMPTD